MDPKFEAILNSLPPKKSRSRLETYSELIREMRRRDRSYQEITQVLRKTFGLEVGTTTVHDFVRAHVKSDTKRSTSIAREKIGTLKNAKERRGTGRIYKDAEVRDRSRKESQDLARTIKALKERSPKTTAKKLLFEYDPKEPLRRRKRH